MKNQPIIFGYDDTRNRVTKGGFQQIKLKRTGCAKVRQKVASMNKSQHFLSVLLATLTGIWLLYLFLSEY